jgi:hypothetical protein
MSLHLTTSQLPYLMKNFPHLWVSTYPLLNSHTWWKIWFWHHLAVQEMFLICTSIKMSHSKILPNDEAPQWWISPSPLFNSYTWWKQGYLFGFILQYRKCFFYVLVYQCQQRKFSPLTKLHIDESPLQHFSNPILNENNIIWPYFAIQSNAPFMY